METTCIQLQIAAELKQDLEIKILGNRSLKRHVPYVDQAHGVIFKHKAIYNNIDEYADYR